MSFKVDLSSVDNFLKSVVSKIDDVISDTLDESAELLISEIQKNAPKSAEKAPGQHQRYAESWKIGEKTENSIIVTTSQGKLYIMLEYQGRKPGRMTAKKAKALHFEKNGVDIFVKSVYHPGFPPMPHVRPAIKKVMPLITDIFYKNMYKKIPQFK